MQENGKVHDRPIDLGRQSRASHFPLTRLLQLIDLLQTERCPNARQLAETCEVSRRTIYRDLAALADAGMNVVYRSDRQGYELVRGLFLAPPRLDEREALALLVLCRQWTAGDDLGLRRHANRAMDKLIQCLPENVRSRISGVAEILSESLDRPRVDERHDLFEQILDAITHRRQIRLWVREPSALPIEPTKLGIYRLTRMNGFWCLVGRSSRHCGVAIVPIAQIDRAELTTDAYTIPPRFNLDRFLARNEAEPDASESGSG
jgi:predicted DNA-binding transcriptional regulator YafY